jgi:serine/threonine protein kinase
MPDALSSSSSLAAQLDEAAPIIASNGWASQSHIDRARIQLMNVPAPVPTAGRSKLSQYCLDQKLLTREQAQDLDSILSNQRNLTGFQLLKKLGSGGMGVVYLAKHLASERICALKTLNTRLAEDSDFVNRFNRETTALSGIAHPHIAEVIECGERADHCYLAMEFIEGPSLMTLLRDYKALPELYALRIVKQVAEGLAHVYSKAGLIHRDIKPENILIVRSRSGGDMFPEDDVAKVIDFGLAKSMKGEDERLTQTGMTIGTPLYMSPEQVRGEGLDCRSDIYALGATLYHLLTGSTPFTGPSPGAIMSAHLTEPIPDPGAKVPSLHKLTRDIVTMAMAKDASQRFLTHEALINACTEVITKLSGQTSSTPRLLRKPMILKGAAVKKSQTDRVQQRPTASIAASNEPQTSITRAIKKAEAARAGMVTFSPVEPEPQLGEKKSLAGMASGAQVGTPVRSAVLDEEARKAVGTGIIPWLALGFSIVAMLVYIIFLR